MTLKNYKISLIIGLSLLLSNVFGQKAELRGYVKSSNKNETISIATVSLLNSSNEVLYSAKTDYKYGEFLIDSIAHGSYTILITARGFKTRRITDFQIHANHRLVKNIELIPEFSRFSKKKEEAPLEVDYNEKERMIQYLMYSGLAVVLVAALILQ
tara:strand:- start:82 stop:549 length:468 start_codon:yes stop_codon:yes gene_type:complete